MLVCVLVCVCVCHARRARVHLAVAPLLHSSTATHYTQSCYWWQSQKKTKLRSKHYAVLRSVMARTMQPAREGGQHRQRYKHTGSNSGTRAARAR
ncbi:hypothetical protein EON67_11560 [archaeon]|nr:MAG: hypothetical protein EON67_11560 [archaeon]